MQRNCEERNFAKNGEEQDFIHTKKGYVGIFVQKIKLYGAKEVKMTTCIEIVKNGIVYILVCLRRRDHEQYPTMSRRIKQK